MDEHHVGDNSSGIQSRTDREIQPVGPKLLHRSADNRLFLGVAGGLGEYFDLDPTLLRVLFVVGTLLGGSAIVVYAVLALIMPSEEALAAHPREAAQRTVSEVSTELQRGFETVVAKARELFGGKGRP